MQSLTEMQQHCSSAEACFSCVPCIATLGSAHIVSDLCFNVDLCRLH